MEKITRGGALRHHILLSDPYFTDGMQATRGVAAACFVGNGSAVDVGQDIRFDDLSARGHHLVLEDTEVTRSGWKCLFYEGRHKTQNLPSYMQAKDIGNSPTIVSMAQNVSPVSLMNYLGGYLYDSNVQSRKASSICNSAPIQGATLRGHSDLLVLEAVVFSSFRPLQIIISCFEANEDCSNYYIEICRHGGDCISFWRVWKDLVVCAKQFNSTRDKNSRHPLISRQKTMENSPCILASQGVSLRVDLDEIDNVMRQNFDDGIQTTACNSNLQPDDLTSTVRFICKQLASTSIEDREESASFLAELSVNTERHQELLHPEVLRAVSECLYSDTSLSMLFSLCAAVASLTDHQTFSSHYQRYCRQAATDLDSKNDCYDRIIESLLGLIESAVSMTCFSNACAGFLNSNCLETNRSEINAAVPFTPNLPIREVMRAFHNLSQKNDDAGIIIETGSKFASRLSAVYEKIRASTNDPIIVEQLEILLFRVTPPVTTY